MNRYEYYIGEQVVVSCTLTKNGEAFATPNGLKAQFTSLRSNPVVLGTETFTYTAGQTKPYTLSIDTTKYNGPLNMRIYLEIDGSPGYRVIGDQQIELLGKSI